MTRNRLTQNARSQPTLAKDFVFSQSSLQVYVDCKRRFWLTYIVRLQWPAAFASPVEEYERQLRLGAQFHRMVQRVEEGICDDFSPTTEYPLMGWFEAYKEHRPHNLPNELILSEHTLETSVETSSGARRLLAKYDLLAMDAERAVIVDWKTGSRPTRPAILRQKMQTMVYPFVLAETGQTLPILTVGPEQIQMLYWFVAAPESPVIIHYDAAQHTIAGDTIARTIDSIISSQAESDFPKVADTDHNRKYVCGFCQFRGYCDRGETATSLEEIDDVAFDDLVDVDTLLDFSLDDVEEIPH